jgi:hypothetical protein
MCTEGQSACEVCCEAVEVRTLHVPAARLRGGTSLHMSTPLTWSWLLVAGRLVVPVTNPPLLRRRGALSGAAQSTAAVVVLVVVGRRLGARHCSARGCSVSSTWTRRPKHQDVG